ncbi:DUF1624 domain-containing protein [Spiractinospora alimapuensis]|nr:DUF1624 domain-containing protein [Spiractinospora alimapuensis]
MDIARALAVFGMFTVHLGVGSIGLLGGGDPSVDGGAAETFHHLTRGRSSALFAFLAGLSLALISGKGEPIRGAPARTVALRVLVRAAILVFLGGIVEMLGTPIAIILVYYGLFFVLALPFLRLGAMGLAVAAATVAVVGPQVSFLVRWATPLGQRESGERIAELWPGPADLFFTGFYPAFTFMAFVLAGMAVGRVDLWSTINRLRLAATGGGLAVLGYGGSWLALYPFGGIDRVAVAAYQAYYSVDGTDRAWEPTVDPEMRRWAVEQANGLNGEVPVDTPAWLLVASPHSGTTFEVLGAVGTALLVLTLCLFLGDWLGRWLYPLVAVGSMPLSVYVGHLVVMAVLGSNPWVDAPFELEWYVLGSLIAAGLWKMLLGRGPLERMMATVSSAVQDGTTSRGAA